MKHLIALAGFALVTAPALARSDTDFPHRDWGQVATLDMTVAEATGCIARELDRQGSVLVLPVEGGNDIDFSAGGMFGGSVGEPWERFKVRREGDVTTLRVFYRHPFNQKGVGKAVERLGKRCLRISSLRPA